MSHSHFGLHTEKSLRVEKPRKGVLGKGVRSSAAVVRSPVVLAMPWFPFSWRSTKEPAPGTHSGGRLFTIPWPLFHPSLSSPKSNNKQVK